MKWFSFLRINFLLSDTKFILSHQTFLILIEYPDLIFRGSTLEIFSVRRGILTRYSFSQNCHAEWILLNYKILFFEQRIGIVF